MRCCAIRRATSSSTISVCARIRKGIVIQPDCADVPYFLRAYFAFKMGLPFGYAKCTRGDGGQPPRCQQWWNIVKEEPPPEPLLLQQHNGQGAQLACSAVFGPAAPPPRSTRAIRLPRKPQGLVPGFGYYLRTTLADAVHSGNGRTTATTTTPITTPCR